MVGNRGLPAHTNVVTFYGMASVGKQVYIVTEFVPDGSLDRYLMDKGEEVEENVLIQMIKDVAAGMDHLATHGIVHRDLAARNLLLEVKRSGYHRVKVCDFGLALECPDVPETRDGPTRGQQLTNVPVRWTAIEVLLHGHFTTKSDVWSFGVTVWEIFSCGRTPYADLSTFEIVDLLRNGYKLPRPGEPLSFQAFLSFTSLSPLTPNISAKCPKELYERIVLRCLADDPDDRPTFHEIYRTMEALYPSIYSTDLVSLSSSDLLGQDGEDDEGDEDDEDLDSQDEEKVEKEGGKERLGGEVLSPYETSDTIPGLLREGGGGEEQKELGTKMKKMKTKKKTGALNKA